MSLPTLDIDSVRAAFPALASGYIFADNAGGSQCLATAAHAITDYLLNTNVQLGADYSVSVTSTQRVAAGAEAARELFNAESADEVAYGSSSTMLVENLARAIEVDVLPGEEIVITGEHECTSILAVTTCVSTQTCTFAHRSYAHPPGIRNAANAGPWKRLAARKGATTKLWDATPLPAYPNNTYAVGLQLDALLPLVTAKTRLVAFTACSNILGSVVPVAEIVNAVRARAAALGARKVEVCVDCVAYAPHRRVDVRAWDADYAYFSFYKVCPLSPSHARTDGLTCARTPAGVRPARVRAVRAARGARVVARLARAPLPPRRRQAVQAPAGRAGVRAPVGLHARRALPQGAHARGHVGGRVGRGRAARADAACGAARVLEV